MLRRSLLLLALLSLSLPALAAPLEGEPVCRFTDDRITESSGLAVSTRGEVLWTHNDSGDTPRFFALDPRSCVTTATYRLDLPDTTVNTVTATAIDWEDMTRTTAADGTPVLLFGDIGDNFQFRAAGVTVYEVAEPSGRADSPRTEAAVPVRAVYQLVYPSGPVDAESLVGLPDGRLMVITKDRDARFDYTGHSEVYVTTGRPTPGPNVMTKLADLDVNALPGADASNRDSLAITGAAVSRDGRRLLVRTYTTAYLYELARGFGVAPTVIPLLASKQGEAISWSTDGKGFFTSSEGSGLSTDPTSGTVDRYGVRKLS